MDERHHVPRPARHSVRFFGADEDLVRGVRDFVNAGLVIDEPVMVIATREHMSAMREHALIEFVDADALLDDILVGGKLDAGRVHALIQPLLSKAQRKVPGRKLRVYGELVNALWAAGREKDAIQLEKLWCRLSEGRAFHLLCGYVIKSLRAHCAPRVAELIEAHGAVLATPELERYDAAMVKAMEQTLGAARAARIRTQINNDAKLAALPVGQAALYWMGRRMPRLAGRVASAATMAASADSRAYR